MLMFETETGGTGIGETVTRIGIEDEAGVGAGAETGQERWNTRDAHFNLKCSAACISL